ncbi:MULTISPECIES: hypothetical protein [Streptomyces]|uniref:Pycsar effector protein domain-containing protein n=1 Tax=Streptomyces chartreusis NRRL 3882 TaxID=1079985 RepID=A0A2N9B9Z4_STRCX|nr:MULTISPECIES: hypothetical protein [Streptomyces]MYS91099.1 hypothetical protein [Streptomyces sp. SID5464]SOR80188.1 hypothetical protein SCNRRL3882_3644 [Streptomyces chartreusis NRRL 3882]
MTTPSGETRTRTGTQTGRAAEPTRDLLAEAREQLAKADSKAGLTLATLGAALTALLGAITGGLIVPGQYAVIPQLLVWAGCAACAPSLVLLGLAASPRRASQASSSGDATQLEVLSRTAWLKYRCIRRAMVWGAAFLTLTLAGTLAGALS